MENVKLFVYIFIIFLLVLIVGRNSCILFNINANELYISIVRNAKMSFTVMLVENLTKLVSFPLFIIKNSSLKLKSTIKRIASNKNDPSTPTHQISVHVVKAVQ